MGVVGWGGPSRPDYGCPSPTRAFSLPQSPGPFPTPLTGLQLAPFSGSPQDCLSPQRPSPKTLGINAFTSTSHPCFPTTLVPVPQREVGEDVLTLDPVSVLPSRQARRCYPVAPAPVLPIQDRPREPVVHPSPKDSPTGRRSSALDLPLGLGCVLPRLLQVQ